MSRVIVIGGGAAGMMAAVSAAKAGHNVTLLEKNEKLGKKLFITGKGRCNLTNDCEPEVFFENVCSNPKFLYSAYYTHTASEIMDFFEQAGCRLKVERGQRVFPVSDHSSDVIRAITSELKKNNVEICLNTIVTEVLTCDNRVIGVKTADHKKREADAVVLATGGLSYQTTGSTGDGYRFARQLGHRLVPTAPSLVPICVKEEYVKELQGLSLKNVSLRMTRGKKLLYEGFGEMLFTHFGVSGPLILTASSLLPADMHGCAGTEQTEAVCISINLKPALSREQLDKRLIREFEAGKNKELKNIMPALLPQKMILPILRLAGLNEYKKVNEVTKEERARLIGMIQQLEMTVAGTRGYEEAVITRGGIAVNDINASTMESKKVKGLFFAGEVMDLDALTGGFNLQIAWSTGMLAGESI